MLKINIVIVKTVSGVLIILLTKVAFMGRGVMQAAEAKKQEAEQRKQEQAELAAERKQEQAQLAADRKQAQLEAAAERKQAQLEAAEQRKQAQAEAAEMRQREAEGRRQATNSVRKTQRQPVWQLSQLVQCFIKCFIKCTSCCYQILKPHLKRIY